MLQTMASVSLSCLCDVIFGSPGVKLYIFIILFMRYDTHSASASEDFKNVGDFLGVGGRFLSVCDPPSSTQVSGDWHRLGSALQCVAGLWLGHDPAGSLGERDMLIGYMFSF